MRFKIIEYKDKKIEYVDYRGIKSEEEMISVIEQGLKLRSEDKNAAMMNALVIYDEGFVVTEPVVQVLKKAPLKDPQFKTAIVGLSGVAETIAKGIGTFVQMNVRQFKTEEEALEWLVK